MLPAATVPEPSAAAARQKMGTSRWLYSRGLETLVTKLHVLGRSPNPSEVTSTSAGMPKGIQWVLRTLLSTTTWSKTTALPSARTEGGGFSLMETNWRPSSVSFTLGAHWQSCASSFRLAAPTGSRPVPAPFAFRLAASSATRYAAFLTLLPGCRGTLTSVLAAADSWHSTTTGAFLSTGCSVRTCTRMSASRRRQDDEDDDARMDDPNPTRAPCEEGGLGDHGGE
mmetsp:Transcript_91516/g.259137  ORF Transcript_91516/g.259137 Transcript_91516/m.259137 type:complete len:226 (-) Transcript_91516:193-870(-)